MQIDDAAQGAGHPSVPHHRGDEGHTLGRLRAARGHVGVLGGAARGGEPASVGSARVAALDPGRLRPPALPSRVVELEARVEERRLPVGLGEEPPLGRVVVVGQVDLWHRRDSLELAAGQREVLAQDEGAAAGQQALAIEHRLVEALAELADEEPTAADHTDDREGGERQSCLGGDAHARQSYLTRGAPTGRGVHFARGTTFEGRVGDLRKLTLRPRPQVDRRLSAG